MLVDRTALAQRVPERESEKERTRRWQFLGDFSDDRQGNGRHSTVFDLACYQSHGPVTDPSGGDQKGVVYVRFDDLIGHPWRRVLGERLDVWAVDMAHKAKANIVNTGESTVSDELA